MSGNVIKLAVDSQKNTKLDKNLLQLHTALHGMTLSDEKKPYVAGPNAVDISPSSDGGVLKEIIKPGSGESTPTTGCKVTVHYTGTFLDGAVFDSSKKNVAPFEFHLGKGQVIKAWDIGVSTMKKGEVAMLTCKPEYAYGKAGSPPTIPAESTLVFEIEVISWQAEDLSAKKDGGILRSIIDPGKGHATPNDFSTVDVHIVCEYEGKVVEDRDVTFCLGEGSDKGIPSGVEQAIEKFKLEEKSRLEIKSQYAWGKKGRPDLNIPADADLVFTVTLKNFERAKESWALTSSEKLDQAKFFKEKGTAYFKASNYNLALKMYKKMIDFVEFDSGFEKEEEAERQAILTIARLNAALCLLKLEDFAQAREQCDGALALEPNNEKGLFRRGQAFLGLSEPGRAILDFEAIVRVDPNNKAAANYITICNQKLKEQKVKEKKIYANMFEKFAQKDREEKDWRFGWWDGKTVEVEKMEEKEEEDKVDEKEKRLQEYREFIRQTKERKEKLEAEIKAKNIKLEDDAGEESNSDTINSIQNNNGEGEPNEKKEEEEKKKQPDVMKALGEWGQEEREREPTDFEKENPNILMLEGTGDFKNM